MRLKAGVRSIGIKPELLLAVMVSEAAYRELGHELVLTSLVDGRHSRASIHYSGGAADLRIRNVPESQWQTLANMIRSRLGEDYDVVLESDHIHLEYQPKKSY